MPKNVWEQFRAPTLQTTRVTLRGANGQDLGAVGGLYVRSFIGKIKVQFTALVARDARRGLLSGTQLRTKEYTFTLNQHESYLIQPTSGARVTMSREGNRDTLKVVCMLLPRAKRELENVRRELRSLGTGQHEKKRENAAREVTVDERITYERTRHAPYDPRCETCLLVHPRKTVLEAAYFDYATVKNSQQGAEVKILVGAGPRGETFARAVHRKGANFGDLVLFLKALQTRYGNIPEYCDQEECWREVVRSTARRLDCQPE